MNKFFNINIAFLFISIIIGLSALIGCSSKDKQEIKNIIHFIGSSCSADLIKSNYCERTIKATTGIYTIKIQKINEN